MVRDVYPEANVELLERIKVFIDHYIDSYTRLDKLALPPQDAFFNKLGGVECSQVDYALAQNVSEHFHW